jgi:membrane protein YqaA with SNARE-associated domain
VIALCLEIGLLILDRQGRFRMDKRIGKVTHYYNRIGVAVLLLSGELKVGDTIQIAGHSMELTQKVDSLEIEHQKQQAVKAGQ